MTPALATAHAWARTGSLQASGGWLASVDLAMNIERFPTLAVDRGIAVRWKGIDELYPNHQIAAMFYAPSFY